jgi:hypothetical protein
VFPNAGTRSKQLIKAVQEACATKGSRKGVLQKLDLAIQPLGSRTRPISKEVATTGCNPQRSTRFFPMHRTNGLQKYHTIASQRDGSILVRSFYPGQTGVLVKSQIIAQKKGVMLFEEF